MMSKKKLDKTVRKRFGSDNKAWLEVDISDDSRNVFLHGLFLGGDTSITVDDVVSVLENDFHIVAGINLGVIARVLEQVGRVPDRSFSSRGEVLLAQATQAQLAQQGRVVFGFDTSARPEDAFPFASIKAAFGHTTLGDVLQPGLSAHAVVPNGEIAELIPHRPAKPGTDIYGRITSPVSGAVPERVTLSAGAYVRVEDNRFYSEIFGYVCYLDEEISVVSPIWVSPDGAEAYYIHLSQGGALALPQSDWLTELLKHAGVDYDVSEQKASDLQDFISKQGTRTGSFLLAQGKPPIPGEDAHLVCLFGQLSAEEKTLSDGSINIEAHKKAFAVDGGECIAVMVPPQNGKPGVNLKGELLPASDGKICKIKAGKNITVENEGGNPRFYYAKFDGNAHFDGSGIEVYPVLRIGGDVDEKTGHINANQDVEILGSVRAGLKVNATGSVTISGVVEGGASVTAKGDVIVGQGVLGAGSKVMAMGNVETKMIEDGSVVARRDILVGDHIAKGYIRTGGLLEVRASVGENGGHILGGEVYSTKGIKAEVIGSANGQHTLVGIAGDMEVDVKIKKIKKNLELCEAHIMRIFRSLNINNLDRDLIEEIMRRTPPGRKKAIAELLVKLKELVAYQQGLLKQQKGLTQQAEETLQKAEIQVSQTAHADTQIRIGECLRTFPEDLQNVVFYLASDAVGWRTVASSE